MGGASFGEISFTGSGWTVEEDAPPRLPDAYEDVWEFGGEDDGFFE